MASWPSGLEIVPFHVRHLRAVVLPEWISTWQYSIAQLGEWARYPSYTAMKNGVIIGMGGILIPYPGLGEVWVALTPASLSYPRSVYRVIRTLLQALCQDLGLRRVEAKIETTNLKHCRFAEHLGFIAEGYMEKYGPNGEPYTMYVIFPKGR